MRPWMGAAVVAAAMLVTPTVALAGEDDPAFMKFKLASAADYDDFEALGLNMGHNVVSGGGDSVIVNAWVTDEELAMVRAHGYEDVGVIDDKYNIDRIRAERDATLAKIKAAQDALHGKGVKAKGKSLADGDVHAQSANYYENLGGRWLAIEANVDGAKYTGTGTNTYSGATVQAEIFDAAGNKVGNTVNVGIYSDPDVNPRYYQYHTQTIRLGDPGSGSMPATVKFASSNGTVDTIAVKEWIAKDPPPYAQGFKRGFVDHYNVGYEAYQKMRDLAGEFGNISEAIKLPDKTTGYQRRAQTMLGYNATTPYVTYDANNLPVAGTSPATATQGSTVVLTSKTYGHLGGNSLAAQIVAPAAGAANQALSVALAGNKININPATNESGAVTSTAKQVVDAINAHPQVSTLVKASLWRTNAGAGVVVPGPSSPLSDLLRAPATVPRGPQDQWMLRIGKVRDGSKVGVFFYCQEHGNELATSGVCLETAERLVRNYGTDPRTTELVDNLDIFIIPQINGDGSTHSIYDSNRRKNLSNYCEDTVKFPNNDTDPAQRNSWGVDMNRNFQIGSIFDGFQGASSTNCLSGNFAGPFEHSEPEVRNETWVQTTFRNIKFANNIHSNGGLFMWPPGAYTPARVALPYPPYGTLNFFDQTAKNVLDGIKSHRGTTIVPSQTGPVIDVLYSAAGNSADEAYYANGIIGFDFEIGTTNYYRNPTTGAVTSCSASQQPPFGDSTNDCLDNEGKHEAEEYASGNYGMLDAALAYGRDTAAPVVEAGGKAVSNETQAVKFTSNEASSIYYTLDGSTPTTASTEWKPPRARALPLPIQITDDATLKWIATDFKGNVSGVGSKSFMIETDKPTATLTGFTEGQVFTQGRPVPVSYSCADEAGGSGIDTCVGTTATPGQLPTGTPGTFTYTVTATDKAGNVTVLERSYTVLNATNTNGGVSGNVPATLALTLGPAINLGSFTPGVTRTYTASTTANVISSAGDAALTWSDPATTNTNKLVNGSFALAQPFSITLSKSSWTAPVSNDSVTITMSQLVNSTDPLRTGTYSKALTFTLSTTTP